MYMRGINTYGLRSSNATTSGEVLLVASNFAPVMEYLEVPKSSTVPKFTSYHSDKHAADLTHMMDTMILHPRVSNHTANTVPASPDPMNSTLDEPGAGSG